MTAMSQKLGKGIDIASGVCGLVAGFLVLVMALLTGYDVTMRYFFRSPTLWAHDYSIYCLVGVCFLAAPFVLREKRHIRVDFLVERLSPQTRAIMEIAADIFALVYIVLLARYSLNMFVNSFITGSTFPTPVRPLRWPVYSFLFLGMVMLSLQQIKELITAVNSLFRQKEAGITTRSILSVLLFAALGGVAVWLTLKVNTLAGLIFLLFVLLFGGVPVAFSLGLLGMLGLFYFGGMRLVGGGSPQIAFTAMDSYTILAIPLFVLTGQIFESGKIGAKLFNLMSSWLGRIPGGLAGATVFSCAVFAAITGSSVACAATIGLFALPALLSRRYNKNLSYGLLASGGTLGILIPPSACMILYASVTVESLGALFIAGFVPGVLLAGIFAAYGMFVSARRGEYEKMSSVPFKEKLVAIKDSIWAIGAPVIILGGIYTGIFTPTEAGATAVIYSLIVGLATRELKPREVADNLLKSMRTTGLILMIVVGAILFGDICTRLQVPQMAVQMVAEAGLSRWGVLIGVMLLWLVMGMFLEVVSIILITVPIVYPVIMGLGFDGVWFGVICTLNMELALLTPPVGLNLYVIKGISGDTLHNVLKGTVPFFFLLALGIILLCFFPRLALWLPSTVGLIR